MITASNILAIIGGIWAGGDPARLRYLRDNRTDAELRLEDSVKLLRERAAVSAELSPLSDLEDQLRRKVEAERRSGEGLRGQLGSALEDLSEPHQGADFVRAPRRLRDARAVLRNALLLVGSGPCMGVRESMRLPAQPVDRHPVRVNRQALRQALGARPDLVEAMELPTEAPAEEADYASDNETMWRLAMSSIYQSSDLPALGTREALQNSVDAIRAAIRAKQIPKDGGRFSVTWDPAERSLTWEDNGIGMDAVTIRTKFLSLGSSGKRDAADSNEAVGGFGIAKAVIIGTSSTFRWQMHTRDNLVVGNGFKEKAKFYKVEPIQGTRLTVYDVDPKFDSQWNYAQNRSLGVIERLQIILGASDLPDITLTMNGVQVPTMFSRRGGSKVPVMGSWGTGTEVTIKAYKRGPGDRQGAYYIRLGGLYQFPASGRNLKSDIVLDFTTTARPGSRDYPFNAARDGFSSSTRYTFEDFRNEVEKESESVGRDLEDEIYDPESDDEDARTGANELGELAAEAFADPEFQRTLSAATGGILSYYAENEKRGHVTAPVSSSAPGGSRAPDEDETPTRTREPAAPPPGLRTPSLPATFEDPKVAAMELRAVLSDASNVDASGRASASIITPSVDEALRSAERGQELTSYEVDAIASAIDRATDNAMGPGGGGLIQAVAVDEAANRALKSVLLTAPPRLKAPRRNPFGRLAGLRINKKNYDRQKAYRFRKNFARWIPLLTVWDATLRLVANEAGIRRRFKPGFVLNDSVLGLCDGNGTSMPVVYIHPDYMASALKAHKLRPLAFAGIVHGVAVHELAHLDGHMGEGHGEKFVSNREDLGASTIHLLPAIATLAQKVLKMPETAEQKSIAELERRLAQYKAKATGKRKDPEYAKLRRELAAARSELAAAQMTSAKVEAEAEAKEEAAPPTPRSEVRTLDVLDAFVGAKTIYDSARLRILAGAQEPEIARLHSALRRAAGEVGRLALACAEQQGQAFLEAMPRAACRRDAPCRDEAVFLHDDHGEIAVRTHCSFDACEAGEIKRRISDWRPHQAAWERTLRLVAQHLGIHEKFEAGLLLCNKAVAYATTGDGPPMLYMQPVLLEQEIAHDPDPNSVAKYLLVCAEHELAHLPHMGHGHSDDFIADREDIGRRTGKLFPEVVEIAEALLRARRPQYENFEACSRPSQLAESCPPSRSSEEHLLAVLAEDPRNLVGDAHDGRKMVIARDPDIPSDWRLTFFDAHHRATDFIGPIRFKVALERAAEHGPLAKLMPAHIPPQPCTPAPMTEALRRKVRDKDREYIDQAYRLFRANTNMSASELERFAASRCGGLAGLSDEPVLRNSRLLRTPKREWTVDDARGAMRTVSFNSRMSGMPSGRPAAKGCESKRDIALKRWAKDPSKPSRGEAMPAGRHASCCGSCSVGGPCEGDCSSRLDETMPPTHGAARTIHESGFEIDPPDSHSKLWNFSIATDTRTLNCHAGVAEVLRSRGSNGAGYDWEQILQVALAEEDPMSASRITWDSEADLFAAMAPSAEPLRSLARCLRRLLDDHEALRRAVRAVPKREFESSKSRCFNG